MKEINLTLPRKKQWHFLQKTLLVFWNTGFIINISEGFIKRQFSHSCKTVWGSQKIVNSGNISYYNKLQLSIKMRKKGVQIFVKWIYCCWKVNLCPSPSHVLHTFTNALICHSCPFQMKKKLHKKVTKASKNEVKLNILL